MKPFGFVSKLDIWVQMYAFDLRIPLSIEINPREIETQKKLRGSLARLIRIRFDEVLAFLLRNRAKRTSCSKTDASERARETLAAQPSLPVQQVLHSINAAGITSPWNVKDTDAVDVISFHRRADTPRSHCLRDPRGCLSTKIARRCVIPFTRN